MKKILFVLSDINIGGPQKSLLALLDNIDYSKFDVSVLVLEPDGSLQDYYNKNAKFIPTHSLITASTIPIKNTLKHLFTFLRYRKVKMFFSAIFTIIRFYIFKKNMNQGRQQFWLKYSRELPIIPDKFDIAFGVMAGLTTYYIVDCVHATHKYHWVRSDYRILRLNKKIEELYYRRVDGALSVSSECSKIFINEFPFMQNKVEVFYNYIPISYYKKLNYDSTLMPVSNDFVNILTISRLDPLKGIEMAIEACEILIKKNIKVKWYVLGDGSAKNEIELTINQRGLTENFFLLGFQMNTIGFLDRCDIFVHPSRTEGKSNAVDEAKYIGKPIVVTNYPTVNEQVENGVTGIICGMKGLEIANSIEKLINDRELAKSISDNCRNKLDNDYDLTKFINKLCNEYKEVKHAYKGN